MLKQYNCSVCKFSSIFFGSEEFVGRCRYISDRDLEDLIGFKGDENDVDEPEGEQNASREGLSNRSTAELTTNASSTKAQDEEAYHGAAKEHDDREGHATGRDNVVSIVIHLPPDGSDDPGETHAEEYVDRVGAGDVADGGVSIWGRLGSSHGGEGIGQGSAHSDKSDTSHGGLQENDTAEGGGDLTDDRGDDANKHKSDKESRPATPNLAWRHNSTEDLPVDSEELPDGLTCRRLNHHDVVLVNGRAQDASNLELLSPGEIALTHEEVEQLSTLQVRTFLFVLVHSLNID